MSQRKAPVERKLEALENWLGRGARSRKLLEILTVKIESQIKNPTVKQTALEDIAELLRIIQDGQGAINWVIKELKL
jgi:hypothetical protein